LLDLDNSAYDYIANVRSVARAHWAHADYLVHMVNHSCKRGIYFFRIIDGRECAVTSHEALSDVISRNNYFEFCVSAKFKLNFFVVS
jgi:hypothetical protein